MSNSVIELAQLLTGALDEKFNIKNQSAVEKVVTCLESFNITHDSYREVQNTRIIKDLQTLRQNKANDQLLAKRIKNLLRKWKERLASSVSIQTNSHSQPNSPLQNFSQGSCDTQFTSQQSQSPPNSLPSTSLSSSQLVNGPTSFKNLLPKSHQTPFSQQNHPSKYQQSVTPPARIISPQNQQHQLYQNGGFESSNTAPASLLGKRKMPLDIAGSSVDIVDENSNHSRKKMMKKSNSGAISSPLAFSNNSNNSLNNFINKNSNNNNNQHQINRTVPVQHQIHSQTALPAQSQPQQPALKNPQAQPKKRGRRKGSKGIDSQLNGSIIPDFQAEIQQKIALSAGKRNKTTFELQQMLEAHQNTAPANSNANGEALDTSSSAYDRVNNFLNTTVPAATYNPPEPPYSIFDELSSSNIKREQSDSIKSDRSNDDPVSQPATSAETLRSQSIEDEIARLNALLPPIDHEAAAHDRFFEYNTYDQRGDPVICTCTFREVITYANEQEMAPAATVLEADSASKVKNCLNGFNEELQVNSNNSINGDTKPDSSNFDDDDDDDDETDDFCAVEDVKDCSPMPPLMRSAVKSIFDPEYDANENLIDEMVQRKPRDTLPKIIEVKIEKNTVKSSRMETLMTVVPDEQPIQQIERVPILTYECDEDPNCPARHFFERKPVSRYDTERLHNSFINGINGFWNGMLDEKSIHDFSKDNEGIDYARYRLWKRVVPRYDFLTLDKVPKQFNEDSPFSIPPLPPPPSNASIKIDTLEDDTKNIDGEDKNNCRSSNGSSDNLMELVNANNFEIKRDMMFQEWHEVMNVKSYNDEVLTILPYVVID